MKDQSPVPGEPIAKGPGEEQRTRQEQIEDLFQSHLNEVKNQHSKEDFTVPKLTPQEFQNLMKKACEIDPEGDLNQAEGDQETENSSRNGQMKREPSEAKEGSPYSPSQNVHHTSVDYVNQVIVRLNPHQDKLLQKFRHILNQNSSISRVVYTDEDILRTMIQGIENILENPEVCEQIKLNPNKFLLRIFEKIR